METRAWVISGAVLLLLISAYLYWRYIWFFRNPGRTPRGSGLVSPADGRVVYAQEVGPREKVIAIKKGAAASINDICRQDLACPKIHIGIFMSPFNVHYNRAPFSGEIKFIRHYPADPDNVQMLPMHWRSLFRRTDYARNSLHLLQNERTVTCIEGIYRELRLPCYIVQIAGKRVRGIESFFKPGQQLSRGEIFGMIRIGSQVDIVVPRAVGLKIRVRAGDRVRAGETLLIE
jgi:phosphatidylserine decarboxylase